MTNSKISIVLLTSEEVCNILNISKRTLQNWRNSHIIRFVQYGRKILYPEAGILEFIDAHHIKASHLKGNKPC
jgi:excisionase family DNA binding protein